MPAHLSAETIAEIERALRDELPYPSARLVKQLAHDYHTTLPTIYKHKKRVQANKPPKPRSSSAKRIIIKEIEEAIILLLDKKP